MSQVRVGSCHMGENMAGAAREAEGFSGAPGPHTKSGCNYTGRAKRPVLLAELASQYLRGVLSPQGGGRGGRKWDGWACSGCQLQPKLTSFAWQLEGDGGTG